MALGLGRRAGRDELFDIYRSAVRGSAFSNVDPTEFYDCMGIDYTALGADVVHVVPAEYDDEYRLNSLLSTLSLNYQSEGTPAEGNEAKKSDFVQPVLAALVSHYARRRQEPLRLMREYTFRSSVASGVVEYVVIRGAMVLVVVEAKRGNWDRGRAQNLLEILVAHSNNESRGANPGHRVYGAVTTGMDWELYSYGATHPQTLGSWLYHGQFSVLVEATPTADVVFSREPIEAFLRVLSSLVDAAIGSHPPPPPSSPKRIPR